MFSSSAFFLPNYKHPPGRKGPPHRLLNFLEMDASRMIASLKEDIEIIEAGLSRLKAQREEQELAPTPLRQPNPQSRQ
ncbi:hypothetical protein FJN17_34030 [Bradyrhizobium symbiodeficiens]|uniref:Uncharacterized protein n=1 Tax=Bradyrhizobium symbiodeficiens TaxID=1404367 RepID=A0ABZ2F1D1_9BRAD|nr:hypothetical protein [Bradyrhizobium symbiodeficiens]